MKKEKNQKIKNFSAKQLKELRSNLFTKARGFFPWIVATLLIGTASLILSSIFLIGFKALTTASVVLYGLAGVSFVASATVGIVSHAFVNKAKKIGQEHALKEAEEIKNQLKNAPEYCNIVVEDKKIETAHLNQFNQEVEIAKRVVEEELTK
ncbi:MAG: hypothetical protein ACI4TI_01345 [Christensenellales bacterium]